MRVDRSAVYRMRALFGGGFIVLGALTLWRIATSPAPNSSKVIGLVLAIALIGLGGARVVQYVRMRRAGRL